MIAEVQEEKLIVKKVKVCFLDVPPGSLCGLSYHNHKKGCPNLGKREDCPPKAKRLDAVWDLDKGVFVVATRFDFGEHVHKMKLKHPDWTDRQCECCLYWQGKARKELKNVVDKLVKKNYPIKVSYCPEAQWVNVTKTMNGAGVILEWPPKKYVWKVALLGYDIERPDD